MPTMQFNILGAGETIMKGLSLTPKQSRFIQEYLNPKGRGYFNATQAAIRAGYSEKTSFSIGVENLKKPLIAKAIAEAQKKDEKKVDISKDRWLRELELIYFADMKAFIDIDPGTGESRAKGYDEMPEDASRVISCIEENRTIKEDESGKDSIIFAKFKFKLHDKLKAGEMIGKHFGYLSDKLDFNVSGKVDVNGIIDLSKITDEQLRALTEIKKKISAGS